MKEPTPEAATGSLTPLLLLSWFAMCAAVFELAVTAGDKLYQRVIYSSLDTIWMTPLAYLILFAPLAMLLLLLRRLRPAAPWFEISIVLSVAFVTFSVFSIYWVRLGPVPTLLLTAGITVQTSRFLLARRAGFARLVRGTLPWMLGIGLLAGVGLKASGWIRERWALGTLADSRGTPNVILLVLDTVRGMSLSLYGYERQTTPALERFAARGVVFENAYAAASWTLPSIATMFTGQYPREHGAGWTTPLPDHDRTLAEVFRDAGYVTAGFVANLNYSSAEVGLGRGFVHYEDYGTSFVDILLSASPGRFVLNNPLLRRTIGFYDVFGRKNAGRLNAALLSWLGEGRERPFFAYLNYYDAHEPYLAPRPFDTRFGPDALRNKGLIRFKTARDAHRIRKQEMSAAERAAEQQAYDASIAYLDFELGRLFAELDRLDLARNTIVIVTADHGELFGEHSLFTHGNSLYLPLLHVPLLLRGPSLPEGARITTAVTLRDLPRTVLELAGLDDRTIPGASFAETGGRRRSGEASSPVIANITPAPGTDSRDPVSKGPMWSAISPPHQYILTGDGTEELFDFVRDPAQSVNLASDPASGPVLHRLRNVIDSVRHRP